MKNLRFILAWIIVSFLLLASVVIVDVMVNIFRHLYSQEAAAVSVDYPVKDMLLGIVSESLRAVLLCYLYRQQKNAGQSLAEAIRFGLVISALIGTMWLIIGYGSFVLKDPNAWLLFDTAILVLQGVLSGISLCVLYKKGFI